MLGGRNINRLSIPRGLSAEGLGPPNPWLIIIAKETLGFRCAGLSPALRLLMPTFSLEHSPASLTAYLRRVLDAPLPNVTFAKQSVRSLIFGTELESRESSAQNSLVSKLLRTF